MAVYTSINYQQPVNAEIMNEHTSEALSPGIYKGMYIRSHGLSSRCVDVRNVMDGDDDKLESRVDLYGFAVMPQGMKVKLTAPQFYNEDDSILDKLIIQEASDNDRIDLVYMQYEYKPVAFSRNRPSYGVIKGTEALPGLEPEKPEIYSQSEIDEETGKTAFYWKKIRIPMAYVRVPAGSAYVTDADIVNIRHSLNTNGVMEYVGETLNTIMGNFKQTGGWSMSIDEEERLVLITKGSGMIGGSLQKTTETSFLDDLRSQQTLMHEQLADINLSLDAQPEDPTCLKITFKVTGDISTLSGKSFTVTGLWVDRGEQVEEVRTFRLPIITSGSDSFTVITDPVVSVVSGGLNFYGIVSDLEDTTVMVSARNLPRSYIIARAQDNGIPRFYISRDPRYALYKMPYTEMLMGYAEEDNSIITIYPNESIEASFIDMRLANIRDLDPMFSEG